ncbi:MAG TPA: cytochrome c biogenesis protein CcdA [Alphaproteobacteria bacterium]|nr:cytochrome c biogenesis protein CcdA [Alphaproteobacteria bacterium]
MADLNLFIAMFAGFVSFLSPCILPILPGFMAYISGRTVDYTPTRFETFLSSLFFVLGFSLVFALLGVLLNTALSSSSFAVRVWLSRIGGLVIIIFALHILGILKIPFLMMDHKIEVKRYNSRYLTSFVFGAAFAVGWSPCVGAILGSIFALAVANPTSAFIFLMFYAIGLGIPFILVGIFTQEFMGLVKRSGKFLKYFNIVVGILLLILGILVFTNSINYVSYFLLPNAFS